LCIDVTVLSVVVSVLCVPLRGAFVQVGLDHQFRCLVPLRGPAAAVTVLYAAVTVLYAVVTVLHAVVTVLYTCDRDCLIYAAVTVLYAPHTLREAFVQVGFDHQFRCLAPLRGPVPTFAPHKALRLIG